MDTTQQLPKNDLYVIVCNFHFNMARKHLDNKLKKQEMQT